MKQRFCFDGGRSVIVISLEFTLKIEPCAYYEGTPEVAVVVYQCIVLYCHQVLTDIIDLHNLLYFSLFGFTALRLGEG